MKGVSHLHLHLTHFTPMSVVIVGNCDENFWKTRHPHPVFWREVSPRMERNVVWSQKDGHRPSATSGNHLNRIHIDFIEIRSHFAVYFDIDEPLIHDLGDRLILKRLLLHHMAPVAGGVANAEEDGLILLLRPVQGLFSPRIPIHRVVGML